MSIEWFRSWHGAPTDSKWLVIARRAKAEPGVVSAVFWALLDHASQNAERGSVEGFDTETYSAWSGFDEESIVRIVRELETKGIIVDGRLAEWDKRQPQRERDNDKSTSADRMRKLRAKKSRVTPGDADVTGVTPSDASVTHVTPSDKDSESDTEKKEKQEPRDERADAQAQALELVPEEPKPKTLQQIVDEEFEETFWPAYPHKVGKPKARMSFFAARRRHELAGIMAGLVRYVDEKPPDRQWLNPTTFLNQDRFADEPAPVAPAARPEPRHNSMLRALAEMASHPADDDGRPKLVGQRRDADGGGPSGDSGGDDDLEIPPALRRSPA